MATKNSLLFHQSYFFLSSLNQISDKDVLIRNPDNLIFRIVLHFSAIYIYTKFECSVLIIKDTLGHYNIVNEWSHFANCYVTEKRQQSK